MTNPITENWIKKTITCSTCKKKDTVEYDPHRWMKYMSGQMVQNVWPEAPADYREKLIGVRSGFYICDTCWPAEEDEDAEW